MNESLIAIGIAIICALPLVLVGAAFLRRNEVVISMVTALMQIMTIFSQPGTVTNPPGSPERNRELIGWTFIILGVILAVVMIGYAILGGK